MKKNKAILLAAAFVLGLSSLAYAGYTYGYVVISVAKNMVTIKKDEGKPIQVPANVKKFRVGDKVKYDFVTGQLRKEGRPLEGC
jgi:hypothetical protein